MVFLNICLITNMHVYAFITEVFPTFWAEMSSTLNKDITTFRTEYTLNCLFLPRVRILLFRIKENNIMYCWRIFK